MVPAPERDQVGAHSESPAGDAARPLDPDDVLARMRSILGDDPDGLGDVIAIILTDIPAEVDALNAAVAVAGTTEILSRAPAIKGMLRNFRLGPLGELFQDI